MMLRIAEQSETYGEFVLELAGIFDPLRAKSYYAEKNVRNESFEANTEFRKIAGAFNLIGLHADYDATGESKFAIFVAFSDTNMDWCDINHDCKYLRDAGSTRRRNLPVAVNRQTWNRFIVKYPWMKIDKDYSKLEELGLSEISLDDE